MTGKVIDIGAAASMICDGDSVSFGGSFLQRVPATMVRELARQGRRNLNLIKPSPSYDADLLALAGCLDSAMAGMVAFERPYGAAKNFRKSVETGALHFEEQTCPTIGAGLRASAQGISFMPLPPTALDGSDIPLLAKMQKVADPYSGQLTYAMRQLRPKWAVIHVAEADAAGNSRLPSGAAPFWDHLLAQAAENVIVTTEKVVDSSVFRDDPERTIVPPYRVRAVVEAEHGAWPTTFFPMYDVDDGALRDYLDLDASSLGEYLSKTAVRDHEKSPHTATVGMADK